MHEITVTRGAFDVLLVALNWRGPKTDDEFFSSHDVRVAFCEQLKNNGEAKDERGQEIKLFEKDCVISLENAAFRYLDMIFKEARPAMVQTPDRGIVPLYLPSASGLVIEAMKAMRNAVEKNAVPMNGSEKKKTALRG